MKTGRKFEPAGASTMRNPAGNVPERGCSREASPTAEQAAEALARRCLRATSHGRRWLGQCTDPCRVRASRGNAFWASDRRCEALRRPAVPSAEGSFDYNNDNDSVDASADICCPKAISVRGQPPDSYPDPVLIAATPRMAPVFGEPLGRKHQFQSAPFILLPPSQPPNLTEMAKDC